MDAGMDSDSKGIAENALVKRDRLVRELAKLDPLEEEQLAEEGLGDPWPEY